MLFLKAVYLLRVMPLLGAYKADRLLTTQQNSHLNFLQGHSAQPFLLRSPIVDSLFPVTRQRGNFRLACKFIIAFDYHVI